MLIRYTCKRCHWCFTEPYDGRYNGTDQRSDQLCDRCRDREDARRRRGVDPLCAVIWGGGVVAAAVFAVGLVTICRWVF